MKTKDLVSVWSAPDNSRLTPKQMSIRLPLHVAAKISALCEMFPKKTKTEIIGDLLSTALEDVTEGLSNEPYPEEEQNHPDDIMGDRKRYGDLVKKYLAEIEMETDKSDGSEKEEAPRKQEDNAQSEAALGSLQHRTAELGARAAKQRRPRTRPGK